MSAAGLDELAAGLPAEDVAMVRDVIRARKLGLFSAGEVGQLLRLGTPDEVAEEAGRRLAGVRRG